MNENQNEKVYKSLLKFLAFMALTGGLLLWLSGVAGAVPGYPPTRKTVDALASAAQPLTASGSVVPAITGYAEGDLFITIASPPILYRLQGGAWTEVGSASSGTGTSTDTENAITLQGRDISNATPTDNQVLTWASGTQEWTPAEASSTTGNATALQGRDITNATPTDGQVLKWVDGVQKWTPGALRYLIADELDDVGILSLVYSGLTEDGGYAIWQDYESWDDLFASGTVVYSSPDRQIATATASCSMVLGVIYNDGSDWIVVSGTAYARLESGKIATMGDFLITSDSEPGTVTPASANPPATLAEYQRKVGIATEDGTTPGGLVKCLIK